jgi:hypothetical protein
MVLVTVVAAIVLVVAAHRLVDAPLRDVTPELIEPTGWPRTRAALLLVTAVPAVEVAIAVLLFRQAVLHRCVAAAEVVWLAFAVI